MLLAWSISLTPCILSVTSGQHETIGRVVRKCPQNPASRRAPARGALQWGICYLVRRGCLAGNDGEGPGQLGFLHLSAYLLILFPIFFISTHTTSARAEDLAFLPGKVHSLTTGLCLPGSEGLSAPPPLHSLEI